MESRVSRGKTEEPEKEGRMIQWTDDLAVNVLDIDNQHKELFARINRFFDAFDRQAGRSEIRGLFAYLRDYISTHFRTEEAYMDKHLGYTYPDYQRHKDQHKAFDRDFREFAKDLDDEAAAGLIVTEFKSWMTNWWLLHVSNTDKGLGKSLKEALLVLRKPS
jgi:hemerythrin